MIRPWATARIERNPALLCAYFAVHSLLFPFAIFPLFWTHDIGMSVTTMLSVQAFFGLSIALFEFPSGYLSDRLGHRRALVTGTALATTGWMAYALSTDLGSVLLAELLLGVGFSLISGTDAALLYDSLRALGREAEFGLWYGRLRSLAQIAEGSSALLAGYLYARWSRLPFALEVGIWLCALALILRLADTPRDAARVDGHLRRMRAVVRHALWDVPELRSVMLLSVAFALAAYLPTWLMPLYATSAGVGVGWVGPIWAAASYCTALGALVSQPLQRRIGTLATMAVCCGLVALGYFGLALSRATLGVCFYFLIALVRGLHMPVLHHEEQRLVPDGDRASSVSLRSLLFRLSFVLLGPVVGASVDRLGQHTVLGALGCATLMLTIGALAVYRNTRQAPAP